MNVAYCDGCSQKGNSETLVAAVYYGVREPATVLNRAAGARDWMADAANETTRTRLTLLNSYFNAGLLPVQHLVVGARVRRFFVCGKWYDGNIIVRISKKILVLYDDNYQQ